MIWDVIAELGHYAGAIPLAACVVLALLHLAKLRDEDIPEDAWLIAGAFFVSFVADTVAAPLGARHLNNWWLGYIYAPIQFLILLVAVSRHRSVLTVAIVTLLVAALISALPIGWKGRWAQPETVVTVLGSLGVAGLLWRCDALAHYRPAVLLYCLAGAPLWFLMGTVDINGPRWIPIWAGYQLVRVVSLGWFTIALVRKEVAHVGPLKSEGRGPEVLRELGAWVPDLGGRPAGRLAQAAKR